MTDIWVNAHLHDDNVGIRDRYFSVRGAMAKEAPQEYIVRLGSGAIRFEYEDIEYVATLGLVNFLQGHEWSL